MDEFVFTVREANAGGDEPVFTVSRAAVLAGMHPQTLRQYDRLGLVQPSRTVGRGRRYSRRDVAKLVEVQRLSQVDGVNLAGIRRILELEEQVRGLEQRIEMLTAMMQPGSRVFTAGRQGEVVAVRAAKWSRLRRSAKEVWEPQGEVVEKGALVVWDPNNRER